jgi:hypothetical protein
MNLAYSKNKAVSVKDIAAVTLASAIYLFISYLLVGLKSDQLVLVAIFNAAYYASAITRKFILGFSIFIVYWILFDYMKAFPNYNYNTVHIAGLYNFEKHLFGIHTSHGVLTPNEYWRFNGIIFLDVLSGISYLCWIPVPLAFAAYLFFRNREQFLRFSLTFFFVNFLGFIVYYLCPAAPPWYVQQHGFKFIQLTIGSTGGLAKFDHYFNAEIFKSIYAKGSNVFAAMPSLHSSYPLIVLYYGIKNRLGAVNVFFAVVMVGIWFAAVYSSHHYVLDVLAGILCAITGIFLFNYLVSSSKLLSGLLGKYVRVIK